MMNQRIDATAVASSAGAEATRPGARWLSVHSQSQAEDRGALVSSSQPSPASVSAVIGHRWCTANAGHIRFKGCTPEVAAEQNAHPMIEI